MLRRFGWFYHFLGLGRILGRVRLEEHSVQRIREAAAKGPLVYVLPHRSTLDHLALNTVLQRRRLPLSVWAHGTTSFFWQPVADAWKDVWERLESLLRQGVRPDPVASGWVARVVSEGHPVTVFVDDRRGPLARLLGAPRIDALEALLAAQESCPRPLQLVPVVMVWNRSPEVTGGQVRSFLLGNQAAPDLPSQLGNVVLRSGEAFCQVGVPLDLGELVERVDPADRLRALHTVLRRYLRRESRLVRGPRLLRYADMQKMVLDNPPMRELARREAESAGVPPEAVRARMVKDYRAIAANFRWSVIRFLHIFLRPLWTRVFSGVDVGEADLERIRAAMRAGSVVLVPCHKSHFDYVLLSWVFFHHDLIVPHVVAGMNLAIWPLSVFLRGAGGFFVKRSFQGDRVFPAVFSRYLRELMRQQYPVEFFIEGGRTRSGKLMRPRVGVLGMVMEAAEVRARGREVTLLPIALAYEQVAEEGAYAAELGGEAKKPETMGQFLRARSVLRRRFGRVYLRVGEPLAVSGLVDANAGDPAWSGRPPRRQREDLQRIGESLIHRIGAVTVVLPSSLLAAALLAHHRRGIRHGELVERVVRFRALLQSLGAPEAASLRHFDQAVAQALDRLTRDGRLEALEHLGERVWSVVPEQRISLDFYRNQILHYFASAAMAAAAVRSLPDGPFAASDALPPFVFLVWCLRREFILDPDRAAGAHLAEGLRTLVSHGALAARGDLLEVADTDRIGEIYGLIRSLLEAYHLVVAEAARLDGRGADRAALVAALQADQAALVAAGTITCPEALSAVTLTNAIDVLVEGGVFRQQEGLLTVHPELLAHGVAQLGPMVR